ncbi:MAG: outer membrane protein assembly factor BamB family protein [Kofleriaceae bacterium]
MQRRTQVLQRVLPPPPAPPVRPGQPRIQMPVAVQRPSTGKWVLVGLAATLPVFVPAAFGVYKASRNVDRSLDELRRTPDTPPGTPTHPPSWQGSSPLFVDIDGNGVVDLIGRSRRVQQKDEVRLIALDGATGRPRWESEPLGSYSDTYQGAVVDTGDLLVFASPRGELRAFDRATGAARWKVQLDERVNTLCDGGEALVAIGTDDVARSVRRSDGTRIDAPAAPPPPAAAGRKGKPARPACKPYPRDDRRRAGAREWEITRKLGVWNGSLYEGPGGRVVSAQREKGTRSPILIAIDAREAERWRIVVPRDPLAAAEHGPLGVAVGEREVCATYYAKSITERAALACFSLEDGARRWDVPLDGSWGELSILGDKLFVSSGSGVEQRVLATGDVRWRF